MRERYADGVQALSYSIIAPVINILALIAVLLLAVAWKYLLLCASVETLAVKWRQTAHSFVFQQPHYRESMGDFYLLSLWQLFSGLIIGQLCRALSSLD